MMSRTLPRFGGVGFPPPKYDARTPKIYMRNGHRSIMAGEPEPMKPDDKPTLLCTEEWCVACGWCDNRCGTPLIERTILPTAHIIEGIFNTMDMTDTPAAWSEDVMGDLVIDELEANGVDITLTVIEHLEQYQLGWDE